MRRHALFLAAVAALLTSAAAEPARAEFGAFARDEASGKFGLSWGRQTQTLADEAAMKDCTESSCKIVFRTRSHQCGAIATATAEKDTAWGAARRERRDAAELAAMTDCQKRSQGQCKVRAGGCNR